MDPKYDPYDIYEYNECGNEIIFYLKSTHQSVYTDDGTVKILLYQQKHIYNKKNKRTLQKNCNTRSYTILTFISWNYEIWNIKIKLDTLILQNIILKSGNKNWKFRTKQSFKFTL